MLDVIFSTNQGAIFHSLTPLIDNEFSIPEERLGVITKPKTNYAEVVLKIFYVPGFHQIRVPLLA